MKQLYVKKDDCPLELEYFPEIKTYKFDGKEYVKVNVCEAVGDYSNMYAVDIELTEQRTNKNAGKFNGLGIVPDKDFSPCYTSLLEEF